MDVREIVPHLVNESDMSMQTMSLKMGRSRTFVNSTIQRSAQVPKIGTVAEIADVCGYDLLLRNRASGDEIIIDPPKR